MVNSSRYEDRNVNNDVMWLAIINVQSFDELKEMANKIMSDVKKKFLKDVKATGRDKLIFLEWEIKKKWQN